MISSEISPAVTITWVTRYIATWYFIFAIFLVSIFLMENMAIALIDKIKMKPGQMITLLIVVIMFGIINTCLFPVLKNILQPDMFPLSRLIHVYVLFDLAFPALIGVGFILIYLRYYRKTNTPG